jgi:hypothetical protein
MGSYPAVLEQLLPIPRTAALGCRLVVTLLSAAMLAIGIATAAANWHLTDLKAYLAAAELLAAGGNPFDVHLLERGLPYHYHYSPWFAALFIPLTALPVEAVRIGWSILLVGAAGAALVPLLSAYGVRAMPLAALMAFLLMNLVAEGNVQPLLLAALVWTLERRAGPLAIGVAASLKITPILLALVYVGRGQWIRALVTGGVAAVLISPTLLFELPDTATSTGGTGLFTSAPVLWAIIAVVAVVATVRLARSRFAWLSASTTTVVALPRLLVFDVTNLLASLPRAGGADNGRDAGPS